MQSSNKIFESKNPWADVNPKAERLIDTKKDLFKVYWSVESDGNYSLTIKTESEKVAIEVIETTIQLKNIDIQGYRSNEGIYSIVFTLLDRTAWEIFHKLCEDLIDVTTKAETIDELIGRLLERLRLWQKLLQEDVPAKISQQVEMGLYAELTYLRDYILPIFEAEEALKAWVGHEGDKQDFVFEHAAVEVKSRMSTKANRVIISSVDQLVSAKENLYLNVFALTVHSNGSTLHDLYEEISDQLGVMWKRSFEKKVMQVGFYPMIHTEEMLRKFVVDELKSYSVTENFPRITQDELMKGISKVTYEVDLSQATSFLIETTSMKLQ